MLSFCIILNREWQGYFTSQRRRRGLEKRAFGKTDMQISALGFGSYKMSGKTGGSTVAEVSQLLGSALDTGMNVIDTAECYGQGEELIGLAVGHRRSDYYLFTKCGHRSGLDLPDWSPQLLERSIERSLQRLRTDHLDLVQLHSCSHDTLRQGEVIEILQRAKAAGKTRYIGYSGDRLAALYAVSCGAFDTLQISVSIADQESIDLTIPKATAQRMGVIAKRSVANGAWKSQQEPADQVDRIYWERLKALNYDFLKGDYELIASTALRFTMSVPGVDIVLIGTTNPRHLQYNLAQVEAGPLPQSQYKAIRSRWKTLTWWRRPLRGSRTGWHACW
jgi:aryl-alcohol dehydrogenase-like predicted oxidoreductase